MGEINYKEIYDFNRRKWEGLTDEPQDHEDLLAGHYSDSNHFVYELLQNAEDAGAEKVMIEYYDEELIFYHDGKPFDEADVRGVTSMLKTTKRDDSQKIGKFGMGFKAVLRYTHQPEIYSNNEAFRIENYLLPVEIENKLDYQKEKKSVLFIGSNGNRVHPFAGSEHLTKIVIPFKKLNSNGDMERVSGSDILIKLGELTGEILLFLRHIKRLYWTDKTTGKSTVISLEESDKDPDLVRCSINRSEDKSEEISNYLKFTDIFEYKEMKSAQVSVAYKLNNRARNINKIDRTDIYVYFPTRDRTDLPFLIHGSFQTAVSREKLTTPSAFNAFLFDKLGSLIARSMLELKKRRLITQVFIREILLTAFQDERNNKTIPGLKDKVTEVFRNNEILPGPDKSRYYKRDELLIPIPFRVADFREKRYFQDSFDSSRVFVEFNNAKDVNFNEYFQWLKQDLGIGLFSIEDLAKRLKDMPAGKRVTIKDFKEFYAFLQDCADGIRGIRNNKKQSDTYDSVARDVTNSAWNILRTAPVIVTAEKTLGAAWDSNGNRIMYINSKTEHQQIELSSVVHPMVVKDFRSLLIDEFGMNEFDNFQYVKENLLKKYMKKRSIKINDEEHIQDIKQILHLLSGESEAKVISFMRKENAYIIRAEYGNNRTFLQPRCVYGDISDEGVDMRTYYRTNHSWWLREWNEFQKWHADTEFYEKHDISSYDLKRLGVRMTIVSEGAKFGINGKAWKALGEYCPLIGVDGAEMNMMLIKESPKAEMSREKSAELLKLMLKISGKLSGYVRWGKLNPNDEYEESDVLKKAKKYKWLYAKDGKRYSTSGITKYDLDESVYGAPINDNEAYAQLGFLKTGREDAEEAFKAVDGLNKDDKRLLLESLVKELGLRVSSDDGEDDDDGGVFRPQTYISGEFPQHRVRNMDNLIEHVRQQFFCADQVQYEKVLRQIRASKPQEAGRSYAKGMYTNADGEMICQMCKEPAQHIEANEISNYGIELPQLHLCLCRSCSAKYKQERDSDKEFFKTMICDEILDTDISYETDKYEVKVGEDICLYFTQTHLAELQTAFGLMEEFGVPKKYDGSDK